MSLRSETSFQYFCYFLVAIKLKHELKEENDLKKSVIENLEQSVSLKEKEIQTQVDEIKFLSNKQNEKIKELEKLNDELKVEYDLKKNTIDILEESPLGEVTLRRNIKAMIREGKMIV